jgi:BASS family bile acid:Na+ symporter
VEQLIKILVTLTLIDMMVATGLRATLSELREVAANWRLLARALVANYVLVPVATVALLRWFDPHPMIAAGFLILAVCPGAPYGPPLTEVAKGNIPLAVGLMVLLAGSSAMLAPLLLGWLLPLVSAQESLSIDAAKVAVTLLVSQLLPLCVGIGVRGLRPAWADRLQKPADGLSKLLNVATIGLILFSQLHSLLAIRFVGLLGMLALILASWAAGWLMGGKAAATQRAMAVTTTLRNISVGLVIVGQNFAGTPAVTAVVAYGLLSLLATLLFALRLGAVKQTLAPSAGTR